MDIEDALVSEVSDALAWAQRVGFPVMVHALHSNWTERAADEFELERLVSSGIQISPTRRVRLKLLA